MAYKERDNIVRFGRKDLIETYEHCILLRMSPSTYNKYGCIKIQVLSSLLDSAEVSIKRFKYAGLIETERKKKPIKAISKKSGESYVLPDAWEITLKKIPVLEMMGEDD